MSVFESNAIDTETSRCVLTVMPSDAEEMQAHENLDTSNTKQVGQKHVLVNLGELVWFRHSTVLFPL